MKKIKTTKSINGGGFALSRG